MQQYGYDNQSLQPPPFQKTNTLLCRNSPPSHRIVDIIKKQQNIQLVFIVVSKQQPVKTKKDTITQCLIADESASIYINFFNQTGAMIQEGDIVYASGIYSSHYKDMLLLYQGSLSIIKRVGRHFFRFNLSRNMSLESLQMEKDKQKDNMSISNEEKESYRKY